MSTTIKRYLCNSCKARFDKEILGLVFFGYNNDDPHVSEWDENAIITCGARLCRKTAKERLSQGYAWVGSQDLKQYLNYARDLSILDRKGVKSWWADEEDKDAPDHQEQISILSEEIEDLHIRFRGDGSGRLWVSDPRFGIYINITEDQAKSLLKELNSYFQIKGDWPDEI